MPVPAYNTFNDIIDSLDATDDLNTPFKSELVKPENISNQNWPVWPGNFQVFNPANPIAVALLEGIDIDSQKLIDFSPLISIVGHIATENLGVEHLVKNVNSNPYIRHLVLWGNDIKGHLPGNALLNLSDRGFDEKKRIINAKGARPILKNLSQSEVTHFRKQVKMINLIDKTKASEFIKQMDVLNGREIKPYKAGLKVDSVEIQRAEPAQRLRLDPAGYFVIIVMKGKKYPLLIEHYSNDGKLKNVIEGDDSKSICSTLINKRLISQLDHAAYIGRELAKAEMSLKNSIKYIQDKAQGELQTDRCQPDTFD